MKRISYNILLIFAYLVFCSKSCENANDRREAEKLEHIQNSQDSVVSMFAGMNVSGDEMIAFVENAKLKLADFLDYIAIAANTTQPVAFQEQSKKMILQLFDNDAVRVLINYRDTQPQETSISGFLANQTQLLTNLSRVKPDSAWVTRQLALENDSIYHGELGFLLSPVVKIQNESGLHDVYGKVVILVKKRDKKFGDKIIRVWSVYFGDLELSF
jgi:hypothetical protein